MIAWENFLVQQIARRRVVIFIGAGVSMNSTNAQGLSPKGWEAFLEHASKPLSNGDKRLINKLMKKHDYLMVCELLRRKLSRSDFTTLMEEEYLTPNYKQATIHEHIFKLDSRIVLTPNFDKIYESYVQSIDNTVKTKRYFDDDIASSLNGNKRVILKTHGTIDSPDKLIFTKSEYAKARIENRLFYEMLEALALTHTFLFIGAGLNDPDIRLLLEDTFFKHKAVTPHYFLIANKIIDKEEKNIIEETTNIKFHEYSSLNNHEELTTSLGELVYKVESEREELSKTQNW
jgi:hypothetical protein